MDTQVQPPTSNPTPQSLQVEKTGRRGERTEEEEVEGWYERWYERASSQKKAEKQNRNMVILGLVVIVAVLVLLVPFVASMLVHDTDAFAVKSLVVAFIALVSLLLLVVLALWRLLFFVPSGCAS
jgi:uncharacterized Tic20 family protein